MSVYLSTPDAMIHIVRRNGEEHVQQYSLLAGVAGVPVDVDEVAAQAAVHLSKTNSLQPCLAEWDVVLPHHLLHQLPGHNTHTALSNNKAGNALVLCCADVARTWRE